MKKKKPKVEKVRLRSLIDVLIELYQDGVDYVNIELHEDAFQDTLLIKEYECPEEPAPSPPPVSFEDLI